MAKIGVTYEQVAAAANGLTSKGKRPTLEAIRRILGTGSNSTLVQHLQIWRSKEEDVQDIAFQRANSGSARGCLKVGVAASR